MTPNHHLCLVLSIGVWHVRISIDSVSLSIANKPNNFGSAFLPSNIMKQLSMSKDENTIFISSTLYIPGYLSAFMSHKC